MIDGRYVADQYQSGRSSASLARELGCSEKTISTKLRMLGIPTKRRIKQNLSQDLSGLIFGRVEVINRENLNDQNWNCHCKCGSKFTTTARGLLRKDSPVRSCGCARRTNHEWDKVPPYLMSMISKKAEYRGIPFNLTLQYCDSLFQNQNECCAISGLPLCFGRRRESSSTTASLDRIDSNDSYRVGNVQWVHKTVNIMKNTMKDSELIAICKVISEFNK